MGARSTRPEETLQEEFCALCALHDFEPCEYELRRLSARWVDEHPVYLCMCALDRCEKFYYTGEYELQTLAMRRFIFEHLATLRRLYVKDDEPEACTKLLTQAVGQSPAALESIPRLGPACAAYGTNCALAGGGGQATQPEGAVVLPESHEVAK